MKKRKDHKKYTHVNAIFFNDNNKREVVGYIVKVKKKGDKVKVKSLGTSNKKALDEFNLFQKKKELNYEKG